MSGRRGAGGIRSLVNARGFQLECASILHESLLMPVLIYVSETMIWKEKERSRIKAVQIDNLRGFLGMKNIICFKGQLSNLEGVPNAGIRS